jgi:spore cortex biosynthesis protein YabQ
MSVVDQLIVFLSVVLLGVLVGVIFDLYRTLRKIWQPGHWGTSLGDALFWIFVTIFVYVFLIMTTWGEVRLYVFMGMGIGLVTYLKLFSYIVRRYLLKFYSILSKSFIFILKLLRVPFKALRNILSVPIGILKKMIKKAPKPPNDPPED